MWGYLKLTIKLRDYHGVLAHSLPKRQINNLREAFLSVRGLSQIIYGKVTPTGRPLQISIGRLHLYDMARASQVIPRKI